MLLKKPAPIKKKYRLEDLAIHRDLQARYYALDKDHVEDLKRIRDAEAANGKKTVILPPKVILVEGKPYVYDGHHTIAMEKERKTEFVTCDVIEGTWEEAVLLAASANSEMVGLKRSRVDKRRAVELALSVAPKISAEELAAHIGDVSGQFVRNIKREMKQEEDEEKAKAAKEPPKAEAQVETEAETEPREEPVAGAAETNGKPEKAAKSPKSGSTKIDKKRITEPLGRLAKELMAVAKNTGTDGTPEFQGFVRTMNELETAVTAWIVKLNKGK